ncbi:MAG: acetolactate synthase small subunit [Clostridium sp.]|uniref:acetolactate synthase small subunit n=1 Tax=Clostridium sp. TaxID=1506 RepID=UPI00290D50E6|nr:acetolactate synthase small subunit [Clostridium sp.]MDU7337960.1 acetolactate synthase small subunit [Clostridium sp.]
MSESNTTEYILSVRAKNTPGVLLRISGLFSRRCYNIISIVAAQTEDEQYSEMIIVVKGDDRIVRQVDKQLSKLEEIEQVTVLKRDSAVVREHLLLRIRRTPENSEFLVTLANAFHASILQVSPTTMILELVGDATALNSLIELCKPYQIEQILRTGAMAMSTQGGETC